MDINLDSELISKDEVDLLKSMFYSTFLIALELTLSTQIPPFVADLSTELIENSSLEREATNYEEKGDESLISQRDNISIGKARADNDMIGKKFCRVKDAHSDGSLSSGVEKNTKITCYPNVPGN